MRTLLFVQQEDRIDWMANLSDSEKNAIKRTYDSLDCVMNSLREELNERHITTKPYRNNLNTKKNLRPGKRNRNAVTQIIKLYSCNDAATNKTIEELFQKLET
jgi:hypothetical protein